MALLAAEEHNFELCSFKITDHYTELFFAEFHKKTDTCLTTNKYGF